MVDDLLRRGVARVWRPTDKPDRKTLGTAFLVHRDGLLVTCAHVIEDEFGVLDGSSPVHLTFLASSLDCTATVLPEYVRSSDKEDLAILQLDGPIQVAELTSSSPDILLAGSETALPVVLPLGYSVRVREAKLTEPRGLRTYGFPRAMPVAGLPGICDVTGVTQDNGFDVLSVRSGEVSYGFSGGPVWDETIEAVVGINVSIVEPGTDLGGRQTETAFVIPVETLRRVCDRLTLPRGNPYRNLEVFEEEHVDFYFGRGALSKQLATLITSQDFVAIVGVSGSGKSSLVRAGLLKGLEEIESPIIHYARIHFRPGPAPFVSLFNALTRHPSVTPEHVATEFGLVSRPNPSPKEIADHLSNLTVDQIISALNSIGNFSPLVLICDQFERLFAECLNSAEQSRFVAALLGALSPRVKVVIAVRADYYGRVLGQEDLGRAVQGAQLTVFPMTDDDLRATIIRPASSLFRHIQPSVVDAMVRDVSGRPGDLPLLEFALTDLWDRDNLKGVLTLETYGQMGFVGGDGRSAISGVQGALVRRAEGYYCSLTDQSERDRFDDLFRLLIVPASPIDNSGPNEGRPVLEDELDDATRELASRLAYTFLLSAGVDAMTGKQTFEVVHEVLIRSWPRLKELRNDEASWRLWYQTVLFPSFQQWIARGKTSQFYMQNKVLIAEAEQWLGGAGRSTSSGIRAFVSASVEEAARADRARARLLLGLVSAAFLLILGVGVAAWWQAAEKAATRQELETTLVRAARFREESRWAEAAVLLEQASDANKLWIPDDLQQRLRSASDELSLLKRLETARLRKQTRGVRGFDDDGSARLYAAAFRDFRLVVDIGNEDVGVVAEGIKRSALHQQLVNAVYDWSHVSNAEITKKWLLAIARNADADTSVAARLENAWTRNGEDGVRALLPEFRKNKPNSEQIELLSDFLPVDDKQLIELMIEAQRTAPSDYWMNLNLGFALRAADKQLDALQYFQAAVALRPDVASSYIGLGLCLDEIKDEEDAALAAFRRAAELDPNDPRAFNGLGNVLDEQHNAPEAEAAYRHAIQLDPTFDYPHHNLGILLSQQRRFAEAEDEHRKALALNSNSAATYTSLAQLLREQGRLVAAADQYQHAIKIEPLNADGHYGLAKVLGQQGQLDAAAAEFRQAIELNPDDASYHSGLGGMLYDLGDANSAAKEYQKAAALDPKFAFPHYRLAVILYGEGALAEAVSEARRAVALDSKNAQFVRSLSRVLVMAGEFAEAPAMLSAAIKLLPSDDFRVAAWNQLLPLYASLSDLSSRESEVLSDKACNAEEYLAWALLAELNRRQFAAAAALYKKAFDTRPSLASDRNSAHRYNAACAAARAGAGFGADAARTDSPMRYDHRIQALTWLRADLDSMRLIAGDGTPDQRMATRDSLRYWQVDHDLVGVRECSALVAYSPEEKDRWLAFWTEVSALERELIERPDLSRQPERFVSDSRNADTDAPTRASSPAAAAPHR